MISTLAASSRAPNTLEPCINVMNLACTGCVSVLLVMQLHTSKHPRPVLGKLCHVCVSSVHALLCRYITKSVHIAKK